MHNVTALAHDRLDDIEILYDIKRSVNHIDTKRTSLKSALQILSAHEIPGSIEHDIVLFLKMRLITLVDNAITESKKTAKHAVVNL